MRNIFVGFVLSCRACAQAPPAQQAAEAVCTAPVVTGRLPDEIREASGIAVSARNPGILWVHNDDVPAILFGIDSTGTIHGRVRVPGIPIVDWEDIEVARCGQRSCLYIGDVGDNRGDRATRAVYRVIEPAIDDSLASRPERFGFRMAGKSHDTEALFVMPDGGMYVISKGRSGPVTLYRFPDSTQPDGDAELRELMTFTSGLVQLPDMVTGAGATQSGEFVAVRTYSSFQLYRLNGMQLMPAYPQPFSVESAREQQGEGIDVRDDGVVFLVSERGLADEAPPISRAVCELP